MTILPDVLEPNLKLVFCGTAAGPESARVGAYYAGPGNRFWDVIYRVGLTPRRLQPHEFRSLPAYGIGLTDIVKTAWGTDSHLPANAFDSIALLHKVREFAPQVLAFNGKRAAQAFCGVQAPYGRQPEKIGATAVFVLPSTSAAARRYWDERYWQELADFVSPTKEI